MASKMFLQDNLAISKIPNNRHRHLQEMINALQLFDLTDISFHFQILWKNTQQIVLVKMERNRGQLKNPDIFGALYILRKQYNM